MQSGLLIFFKNQSLARNKSILKQKSSNNSKITQFEWGIGEERDVLSSKIDRK